MDRLMGKPVLPFSTDVASRLITGEFAEMEGLTGPSRAAAVADLVRLSDRNFIIICNSEEQAQELAGDLRFFLGEPEKHPDFIGESKVLTLLPEEISPYDSRRLLSAGKRRMEMLANLYAMTQPFRPRVLITTAWGVQRLYPPRKMLETGMEYLLAGVEISRDELVRKLVTAGYRSTPVVEDAGDFNRRGSIIDIYCPLYAYPLRLDFWGDELESIKLFDPRSQKSLNKLDEAFISPVRELILTEEVKVRGRKAIEGMATERGLMDRHILNMLTDLEEGLVSAELDQFLPLFYEKMDTLFDYLPSTTVLYLDNKPEIELSLQKIQARLEEAQRELDEQEGALLAPEWYFLSRERCWKRLLDTPRIEAHHSRVFRRPDEEAPPEEPVRLEWDDHTQLRTEIAGGRGELGMLAPLMERVYKWHEDGLRVFVVAHNRTQAERFSALMKHYEMRCFIWDENFPDVWRRIQAFPQKPELQIVFGELSNGQVWPEAGLVFLREGEIFARSKVRRSKVSVEKDAWISSIEEIQPGDFLVHREYGIGIYRGLKVLEFGPMRNDFLHIEYQGQDKLYLPVTQLDKIHKFGGAEGKVPSLDRIGGSRWIKGKARAKAAIRKLAGELVKLQAERQLTRGFSFSPPDEYFRQFEANFPHEETPDQETAIADVLHDMQKDQPMDRLVCGDVGFGKTEVAMRAAFKAVLDGKQVAVLVPTTVLALQHAQTFKDRMRDFPVKIEMISRLRSNDELRTAMQGIADGRVDIAVGTHKLLSKEIKYADLGLLIVDEEHRFGVAQKERIKSMRANVDILTMTATPIPRTLNMAFSNLRDLSIIQTAPMARLSIRTFISPFDENAIKEAIMSELSRGGQVYFIHNRVQSIEAMSEMIRNLVPAARIAVAHGQMPQGHLERVMVKFVKRETNVLIASTILESGIDIPTVNTIIINRADTFGLAQLYQLRGRVGRGGERAYAHLLIPSRRQITKDAEKRLAVLMRFTDLGAGFRIASHDLEIRGAGNLLGAEQSGHIAAVGIELYLELVEEAIRELKGEDVRKDVEPEINLPYPAFLPEEYISDMSQRLQLYKRLSRAKNEEELAGLYDELEDRFGNPPQEVVNLRQAIEYKIILRDLGMVKMDLGRDGIALTLGEDCRLDPEDVVLMVQQSNGLMRLTPEMKLFRRFLPDERRDPSRVSKKILQELVDYGT